MDLIDWMKANAKFMAADRPDLYSDPSVAFSDLSNTIARMNETEDTTWTAWAGFFLLKWVEDGITEWVMTKKISSASVFPDEGQILLTDWTKDSGTLKVGVDLQSPDDVDFE